MRRSASLLRVLDFTFKQDRARILIQDRKERRLTNDLGDSLRWSALASYVGIRPRIPILGLFGFVVAGAPMRSGRPWGCEFGEGSSYPFCSVEADVT